MAKVIDQVRAAARYVRSQDGRQPTVGIVLGSGLGAVAELVGEATLVAYADIPHFPRAGVAGHKGELVIGSVAGKTVAVLAGRIHYYEGHHPGRVTFPIRVLRELGCETLIVTNAAGGLNHGFSAGDLMLIEDHINFVGLAGGNPLRGLRTDELGARFCNMTDAYDPELRRITREVAGRLGEKLAGGVYAMVSGPSYETPAEMRFLHLAGADAVGMSTATEVIVARQVGLRVLGISCIANVAHTDDQLALCHAAVLDSIERSSERLARLLEGVIGVLP